MTQQCFQRALELTVVFPLPGQRRGRQTPSPYLGFLLRREKPSGTKKGSSFTFPEAVQSGAWPPGLRHRFAVSGWPGDLPASRRTAVRGIEMGVAPRRHPGSGLQKPAAGSPRECQSPTGRRATPSRQCQQVDGLPSPSPFPHPSLKCSLKGLTSHPLC